MIHDGVIVLRGAKESMIVDWEEAKMGGINLVNKS